MARKSMPVYVMEGRTAVDFQIRANVTIFTSGLVGQLSRTEILVLFIWTIENDRIAFKATECKEEPRRCVIGR
jgi:hypothetical protein